MSDFEIASYFSGGPLIGWIVVYGWMALCLHVIANKTSTQNGWLAWIPIANIYLLCKIGRKPGWWTILLFIPLVNIVIGILVCINVARIRQRSSWLGVLMMIPFINVIPFGVLAFSE